MSTNLKLKEDFTIFDKIESHLSWKGSIAGLSAEKLLRGKKTPFLFLIRQGEPSVTQNEKNYYITFVTEDLTIKHQPLVISDTTSGWCYENCKPGGPYTQFTIDDVLHLIMKCEQGESTPFVE